MSIRPTPAPQTRAPSRAGSRLHQVLSTGSGWNERHENDHVSSRASTEAPLELSASALNAIRSLKSVGDADLPAWQTRWYYAVEVARTLYTLGAPSDAHRAQSLRLATATRMGARNDQQMLNRLSSADQTWNFWLNYSWCAVTFLAEDEEDLTLDGTSVHEVAFPKATWWRDNIGAAPLPVLEQSERRALMLHTNMNGLLSQLFALHPRVRIKGLLEHQ